MVDHKSTKMINSSASLRGWSNYQLNLDQILENNSFQRKYFPELQNWRSWNSWDDFSKYAPLTTKQILDEDRQANPPHGSNFTYSLDQYSRYSRTSGTSGKSMTWLDTQKDWEWMLNNWRISWRKRGLSLDQAVSLPFPLVLSSAFGLLTKLRFEKDAYVSPEESPVSRGSVRS